MPPQKVLNEMSRLFRIAVIVIQTGCHKIILFSYLSEWKPALKH